MLSRIFMAIGLFCWQAYSINIDGQDSDWDAINDNVWFDSRIETTIMARDLSVLKISSDAEYVYLYIQLDTATYSNQYWPEINFFIDRDFKGSTGRSQSGYETELTIAGASNLASPGCEAGCVRKTTYTDLGGVIQDIWLSTGWAPNSPNHNANFIEARFTWAELQLEPGQKFRFWVGTRKFTHVVNGVTTYSGGDYLRWYNDPRFSSLTYPRPVFQIDIAAQPRKVEIDGVSDDWRLVSNAWFDTIGDFGGGSRDLEMFKATSDNQYVYLYFQFAKEFGGSGYPEINLYLDTDLNAATGRSGTETELVVAGASAEGPCPSGCTVLWKYDSSGNPIPGSPSFPSLSRMPSAPHHGRRFIETRIPKDELGLPTSGRVRFILRSRDLSGNTSGDFLKNESTVAMSSLFTSFSSTLSLDGVKDDWHAVPNSWADPKSDFAGNGYANLTQFALKHDQDYLYLAATFSSPYGSSQIGPEVYFLVDADGNPSNHEAEFLICGANSGPNCTQGALGKYVVGSIQWLTAGNVAPDRPGHGKDVLEARILWTELPLQAKNGFRFILRSRDANGGYVDYLAGYDQMSASRLAYPKEILQIGVNAKSSEESTLLQIKETFKFNGPDSTFKRGNGFDVHLTIHGEEGTWLDDGIGTAPGGGYHVNPGTKFNTVAGYMKKYDLAYVPLLAFHQAGDWFRFLGNKDAKPRLFSGDTLGTSFMPYLPYATGYSTYGMDFGRAFGSTWVDSMLGSYIRIATIGNEVTYRHFTGSPEVNAVSFDLDYTMSLWNQPWPPLSSPTTEFLEFRSRLLMNSLQSWVRSPLEGSKFRLPTSTKLVPYAFTDMYMQTYGYFPYVFGYLNEKDNLVTAVDIYPLEPRYLQIAYRFGKSIAITEFGGGQENSTTDPDQFEITEFLMEGVLNQAVRTATMYAWNDPKHTMQEEQKKGLKMALQLLTELPAPKTKDLFVRAILPNYMDSKWYLLPQYAQRMDAMENVAEETQYAEPRIAFEMDSQEDGRRPDVLVKVINSNANFSAYELQMQKSVYLLMNPATTISIDGVPALSIVNNPGGYKCKLADMNYTIPVGTEIFDGAGTPESGYGNDHMVALSGTFSTLLNSDVNANHLIAVRYGKTIFIANDILNASGTGFHSATKFLSESIIKLAKDQF